MRASLAHGQRIEYPLTPQSPKRTRLDTMPQRWQASDCGVESRPYRASGWSVACDEKPRAPLWAEEGCLWHIIPATCPENADAQFGSRATFCIGNDTELLWTAEGILR